MSFFDEMWIVVVDKLKLFDHHASGLEPKNGFPPTEEQTGHMPMLLQLQRWVVQYTSGTPFLLIQEARMGSLSRLSCHPLVMGSSLAQMNIEVIVDRLWLYLLEPDVS